MITGFQLRFKDPHATLNPNAIWENSETQAG